MFIPKDPNPLTKTQALHPLNRDTQIPWTPDLKAPIRGEAFLMSFCPTVAGKLTELNAVQLAKVVVAYAEPLLQGSSPL